MVVEQAVYDEWHEHHALSRAACHWFREHADVGDPHPVISGIEELRRMEAAATVPPC